MVYEMDNMVKDIFEKALLEMKESVDIFLFSPEMGHCIFCKEMEEFIDQVAEFSGKINVIKYLPPDSPEAKRFQVAYHPAMAIVNPYGNNVKYYGIPRERELMPFINGIVEMSKGKTDLKEKSKKRISKISNPFDIKVFTTPSCPYCPSIVETAIRFAIENEYFNVGIFDITDFPDLVAKYQVISVPKLILRNKINIEERISEKEFVDRIIDTKYQIV